MMIEIKTTATTMMMMMIDGWMDGWMDGDGDDGDGDDENLRNQKPTSCHQDCHALCKMSGPNHEGRLIAQDCN
ncbi:hypothetical protein O181_058116 [Austropuccinia psidii MF-1]|uniref:Uncharacterized protein n=1 Tax=Austropuccinia psidii MF-1 TaxID=1389203 RepID=A0A9Q3E9L7_9BASI|nr:hypothetical protein [Austropuccinia psidii MF-1]